VGDNLDIAVHVPGKDRIIYRSRIEDKFPNKRKQVLVPVPTTAGAMGTITEASKVEILIYKGQAKIVYRVKIAERVKVDGTLYFIFDLMNEGERVNERNFFRADVMMDLEFVILKRAKQEEDEENKVEIYGEKPKEPKQTMTGHATEITIEEGGRRFKQGTSRDISGGGMQITSLERIDAGDFLTIHVPLNNEKLMLTGQVVFTREMGERRHLYGIKFIGVSGKEQDKILKFVLDLQRKATRRN
jgi:c-di-GMP-binding flagellar brake protein YcgR